MVDTGVAGTVPQAIVLDVFSVSVQEAILDQLIVEFAVPVQALLPTVLFVQRSEVVLAATQVQGRMLKFLE